MIGAADPAIAADIEASAETTLWNRRRISIARIAGPGISREGHPIDREKLRRRCIWRARRRIALNRLADILDAWPVDMELA